MKTKLPLILCLACLAAGGGVWLARCRESFKVYAQQDRGQTVRANAPEQRLALVIGNGGYKESPLTNPVNDARDMAAALRACGFEVLTGEDRNQRQMKELIRQFGQRLKQGGVGLFFFAGHGIQANGRNYLIPIGAEINAAAEIEYESVEMGFALAQMEEARNRLNVVILDACRNNPYARSFRSDTRGLAGVRNAPSGTLIAYATAADDVAADGSGRNGLFTGELLTNLKQPGLTLEQVFRRTRTNVRGKSNGKQVPYEYSSVEGEDFYFLAPAPVATARTDEETAWNYAKRSRNSSVMRLFLSDYPNSPQAAEARRLLAELEKLERPAANANPPVIAPATTNSNLRMSATGVALTALPTFTTVKVDDTGKVIERNERQECWGYVEDLGNGVKLELVEIPAGEFEMGSNDGSANEKPVHKVSVNGFLMGKTEVTQAQWRAVSQLPKVRIDLKPDPSNFKGDTLPVEQVNWDEAVEFCARLSRKTGGKYGLPSEAEWEYAARARTTTAFAFGATITPELVNYDGNYPYGQAAKGQYRQKTFPAGSFPANAWGLFDMHGNVWEWCEDDWHGSYKNAPSDGRAWVDISARGSIRVFRGGGWFLNAVGCRSAYRNSDSPDFRSGDLGFRLVRR